MGGLAASIWTYANGIRLIDSSVAGPCNTGLTNPSQTPSFVYYCETGANTVLLIGAWFLFQLFPSNTLQQCVDAEASCCAPHPNLPWSTKTLDETTTEDIVCGDQGTSDEDILRYK